VNPSSPTENNATTNENPLAGSPAFSPLYQQIKGLVLQSLHKGEWKPGDPIPSEFELAARYKVSQGTVRKAIDELAKNHLLVRRQGKGTFVATHAEQQVQFRFLKLQPDAGDIASQGPAQRDILDCQRLQANSDLARKLGIRTNDAVFLIKRVLSFGGTPTIFEEVWLPGGPFKGLTAERLRADTGPMYAMFEAEFGIRMVHAQERIRAVKPTPEQAQSLQVQADTPLLRVERLSFTYQETPMEWRIGVYRTDQHHYLNELN
jgi:GntR family transcriptional regulator